MIGFRNLIEGRGATTNPAAKWTNCRVPYTIANTFSQQERGIISAVMSQFEKETGIKWYPNSGSRQFVHIARGKGCSSLVGKNYRPGGQLLSLGKKKPCCNTCYVNFQGPAKNHLLRDLL